VLEYFAQFSVVDPSEVKLPEQPAALIPELGAPLGGMQCKRCSFITINIGKMKTHCRIEHQISWTGDKSVLYSSVKVQTFFSSGGLQKYFIVDLGAESNFEDGERLSPNQVAQKQLSDYQKVRKQINDDMQVMEEAAKTDKTGWFTRTKWLPFLKGRNLAHL
jgi:hypothetical protein